MRKRQGVFICFIGIDGSGKTTQAQALAQAMKRAGFHSRYVWNRFEPQIAKPFVALAKRLFFRGKDIYKDYDGYSQTKQKLFDNRLLSAAYQGLLWLDYFYQISWKVRLPLMRGETIVCDRYIYDTVADLTADSAHPEEQTKSTLNRYLRLFPKPDLVFLIDLPEEIAYQRKNDVPAIDYLRQRRKAYLYMSRVQPMTLLDGTRGSSEVADIIQSKVKEYIGAK